MQVNNLEKSISIKKTDGKHLLCHYMISQAPHLYHDAKEILFGYINFITFLPQCTILVSKYSPITFTNELERLIKLFTV